MDSVCPPLPLSPVERRQESRYDVDTRTGIVFCDVPFLLSRQNECKEDGEECSAGAIDDLVCTDALSDVDGCEFFLLRNKELRIG